MRRGDQLEIDIIDYAFGGKGIGKIETPEGQFIVFIEHAIPGQKVLAHITNKRKRFAEGNLLKVLERSSLETVFEFQPVSGAPYITLLIEKQRELKKSSTLDQYKRIGEIHHVDEVFDQYIASPVDYFYRNKMEYSFSCIERDIEQEIDIDDSFAVGFKTRGTWWKVENLNKPCGLFDAEFEKQLKTIRDFLKATDLPAWHPPQKKGFFRHLVVRKSFSKNQFLINLVTSSQGIENFDAKAFTRFTVDLLGERLAGLQHTVNDDVADRSKIENGNNHLLFGEPVIIEKLLGLEFEISMESFFQTNPQSAELLYQQAIAYAQVNFDLSNQLIMDLFCGTGTIGQIMASKINDVQVIGVDIVEEAIRDAKRNAIRNNIHNLKFHAADVGKFLLQFPEYKGKIHTIMLDPPRAGIAPKTLNKVIDLNAKQIVYISCNPATQARDSKTLAESGYVLKKLSLVDQFPHTAHIEAVGLYVKD